MDRMEKGGGIQVPEQTKVKSLYKAVQLLFYFTEENRELGVTELAQKSGLLKSSVCNMLSTFEECGLVQRNPETNRYRLGIRVLELSNQFYSNNDVTNVAKPHLKEIANQTGETVYLAVANGIDVIYLDGAFPDTAVSSRNMTGLKAPLYCTGIGKALLAYSEPSLVDQVIANGFQAFTENTIVDGEQLRQEVDLIRRRGYSVDNMEHEFGIKCVAVPIRNSTDQLVAAYSITGPSPRFGEERQKELAQILKSHAEEMKKRL